MASGTVERPRRRKIALACEPCRDRKSRCDGGTPICSACQRRNLPMDLCIYTLDNARTASSEAYIRTLHERIRALESACRDHDVPVPSIGADTTRSASKAAPVAPKPQERSDGGGTEFGQLDGVEQTMGHSSVTGATSQAQDQISGVSPQGTSRNSDHNPAGPLPVEMFPVASEERVDSPDAFSGVTAMGTLSTSDGDAHPARKDISEFYGSSSTAFFVKETYGSIGEITSGLPSSKTGLLGVPMTGMFETSLSVDLSHSVHTFHFSLPPRSVADRLLNEFWQRVYYLYPIFHRPTFENAYQSLWDGSSKADTPALGGELGLGGSPGAGPTTIVFHCALNTIFALGCSYIHMPILERSNVTQTYFLRAKQFIGLDLLEMHNIGVVQTLLLMTLFLQSTPFASRCWNSVGIACRVGQGLGLHVDPNQINRGPIETEIRRRTWHGCVVLDRLVSMTFGRPTMTAHLYNPELPSTTDLDINHGTDGIPEDENLDISRYDFNVEHIRLCNILGNILSQIFQSPNQATAARESNGGFGDRPRRLDTILMLDAQLSEYARTVHPNLSWMQPRTLTSARDDVRLVLERQRNVLHIRFLYFRLMLHRPSLTEVCMAPSSESEAASLADQSQVLYKACAVESAKVCIQNAISLLDALSGIYKAPNSTSWWWTGLYTSTAGLVLLIGRSNPVLEAYINQQDTVRSWQACQAILTDLSPLSPSARRSIKLLQALDAKLASRTQTGNTVSRPQETIRLENDGTSASKPLLNTEALQIPMGTAGTETLNQVTDGAYPVTSMLPGLQAQDTPDFDIEGLFIDWDQAINFMSDIPGFSDQLY